MGFEAGCESDTDRFVKGKVNGGHFITFCLNIQDVGNSFQ